MNTLNLSDNAAELAHLKLRVAQLTSTLEEISNTTWGGDCRSKAKAELQRQPTSLPTFFMGTDGTVCTHRMNESDIPVWCQSGEDGALAMRYVSNPGIRGDQIAASGKDLVKGAAELVKLTSSLATERDYLAARNAEWKSAAEEMFSNADDDGVNDVGVPRADYEALMALASESPIKSLIGIEYSGLQKFKTIFAVMFDSDEVMPAGHVIHLLEDFIDREKKWLNQQTPEATREPN